MSKSVLIWRGVLVLDSKTTLISASKLKAAKLNTDISYQNTLMNFDNVIVKDLMPGLYRFTPSLLILLFWHWPYSLYCVIQCIKEIKIHSVETKSELSQKSSVKVVKRKTWSKVKVNLKKGEHPNNSRLRGWRLLKMKRWLKWKNILKCSLFWSDFLVLRFLNERTQGFASKSMGNTEDNLGMTTKNKVQVERI